MTAPQYKKKKVLEQVFIQENIQMASKYIKRCSIIVKKIKIKTIVSYHSTLRTTLKKKKKPDANIEITIRVTHWQKCNVQPLWKPTEIPQEIKRGML